MHTSQARQTPPATHLSTVSLASPPPLSQVSQSTMERVWPSRWIHLLLASRHFCRSYQGCSKSSALSFSSIGRRACSNATYRLLGSHLHKMGGGSEQERQTLWRSTWSLHLFITKYQSPGCSFLLTQKDERLFPCFQLFYDHQYCYVFHVHWIRHRCIML